MISEDEDGGEGVQDENSYGLRWGDVGVETKGSGSASACRDGYDKNDMWG